MKKLELFKEKPWILFFLSMLTACSPLKEKNSSNIIASYRDWETDRKSTRLNSSH